MSQMIENLFRVIEEFFEKTPIPAGKIINQLPASTLPPGGPAGVGYPPDPDAVTRVDVRKNSTGSVFSRRRLNLIEGSGVTLTVADDSGNEEVDITVAASAGGVSDGDKGDVTVSGTGTVWTVDNDVVTFAKMQNIATDKLLGRDTASSGDVEEIGVSGGLEFTGSGGIQRSALTGDVTASAGSNSTTLAASGVTAATYGDSTHVGQFTVDAKGRVTAAVDVLISGGSSSTAIDSVSLLDRLRGGTHADELFTLTNGVNEFDLWYVAGTYYLAYDDKTETKLRSASTIAGLSAASDTTPVSNGRYPALFFDGTTWHLWVWIAASTVTRHYTSATFTGTYTLSDSLASNLADVHVRQSGSTYYAGYKNTSTLKIGVLSASSLAGAWTDLGYVFATIGRANWHATEEADPAPFVFQGRTYISFGGYDGTRQRAAIVECDPTTWQAIAPATVIVDPLETWQQRNSNQKVFNPVFLPLTTEPGRERLYYSQNPNASGTATGWSYVDLAPAPQDGRKATHGLLFDTNTARDLATGILSTPHGSATWGPNGLVTTASNGGAYGWLGIEHLGDFSITVEFTAGAFPSGGSYALLVRASTTNSGANPIAAIWIRGTGTTLYAEVHNNAGSGDLGLIGAATLSTGVRYRATLRKLGGAVVLFLNGASDASGSHSGSLTTLTEWALSNQKGSSQANAQNFQGTIHRAEIIAEALPLGRV